jgi:hypothetical protein
MRRALVYSCLGDNRLIRSSSPPSCGGLKPRLRISFRDERFPELTVNDRDVAGLRDGGGEVVRFFASSRSKRPRLQLARQASKRFTLNKDHAMRKSYDYCALVKRYVSHCRSRSATDRGAESHICNWGMNGLIEEQTRSRRLTHLGHSANLTSAVVHVVPEFIEGMSD